MFAKQKISTCLWFDNNAEEAALFYVSIFRDAKILSKVRYGEAGPGPKGSVMVVTFQLEGREFIGLNGGPYFKFSEAISLYVHCTSQDEIDYFWQMLGAGGQPGQCGWLKDKFGLSWQVVPDVLSEMLADPDPEKARRVTEAMLKMGKLDIKGLKSAYNIAD